VGVAILTAWMALAAGQEEATKVPDQGQTTRPADQLASPLIKALGLTLPTAGPMAASQPAAGTAEIRPYRPGTFEIHVQGADLRGVLQLLSTQGRKNIVATKEVTGTVTADLYGVTFKEALDAVLQASGFVYREKDGFVYVYTAKQLEDVLKGERKMGRRVFHLAYVTATDAKTLIAPVLSKEAVISATPDAAVGVATSGTDTGGNSNAHNDILIVQDYEDNLKQVEKILQELDVRPDQVLVEVTMLSAKMDEGDKLGVNFSTLAGIDFETLGSDSNALGNMANAGLSDANLRLAPASTFRTDFTTISGGATFGLVTNNVAAFITALESITDTTVLANPKLLIVNKQRGEVMIGAREGYLTTTVTEGTATQSVEFLETGTKLIVRPYVARDGFVRLELHPEDSDGGVSIKGDFALPSETTTEITTNVMVRDGHTIILGGLFREQTTAGRAQIPLLGNLPILGAAFRYTNDATVRKETIILITPHIIKQAPDAAVSERLKDDVERLRIGARRGVQWWGRDRLAQTYVGWARQALTNGHRTIALWNVDMALSMQPFLEEAILLKERLTGQPVWADYAQESAIRYVIQRMIMQDLGKPVETVIPPAKPRSATHLDPKVQEAFGMGPWVELPLEPSAAEEKDAATVVGGQNDIKVTPTENPQGP
jgi:type IV pilus assembly protein PilQ